MLSSRNGLFILAFYMLGLFGLPMVLAFNNDRSDNLAVYWGQNGARNQERLSFYCQDDTIDVIPMAFLYVFFGEGGKPMIDHSNICGPGRKQFPNSNLADCSFLASDIKQCQTKGKLVTLSLGGATAKVGFGDASQARDFADTIWNMFLGGQSNTRPFGDAVLDGVDLDIESGSASYYTTFVKELRALSDKSPKRYYITAAPQCPFPDAKVGDALDNADFDAIYVQFYNNYCETSRPSDFNFGTWDHWAKTKSPNPNIKIYLGAPASPEAAGSGYVNADTLIRAAKNAQKQYSSFGGVMLWDADTAYNNGQFDQKVKDGISTGQRPPSDSTTNTTPGRPGNNDENNDDGLTPTSNTRTRGDVTSTVVTGATLPTEFRDPRATARVRRPTFTLNQREAENTVRPRSNSRIFHF